MSVLSIDHGDDFPATIDCPHCTGKATLMPEAFRERCADCPRFPPGMHVERRCPQGHVTRAHIVKMPAGTVRRDGPKVGRNERCPCGSGRKAKAYCGRPS